MLWVLTWWVFFGGGELLKLGEEVSLTLACSWNTFPLSLPSLNMRALPCLIVSYLSCLAVVSGGEVIISVEEANGSGSCERGNEEELGDREGGGTVYGG